MRLGVILLDFGDGPWSDLDCISLGAGAEVLRGLATAIISYSILPKSSFHCGFSRA